MIRIALAALSFALLAAPAAQALEAPPICKALNGLAEEARRTGEPQRLTLSATDQLAGCPDGSTVAAKVAFCKAAEVSEMARPFPWPLKTCVNTMAADPQYFAGPNGALTRLTAKLGGGVRLDVSATGGGRYDVVVWKAK